MNLSFFTHALELDSERLDFIKGDDVLGLVVAFKLQLLLLLNVVKDNLRGNEVDAYVEWLKARFVSVI